MDYMDRRARYLARDDDMTREPSAVSAGRLVSYRREQMAESERARQLRQHAERLAELRRYL